MERSAQRGLASVPRIYRREAAPDVREYLVLNVILGGSASGKYVGIRSPRDGVAPEIETYEVTGNVAGDSFRLRRPGRGDAIVDGAGWRRVSRDEVDDDVVRFAERGVAPPRVVMTQPRSAESAAREATAAREAAELRAAEAQSALVACARAEADALAEVARLANEAARLAAERARALGEGSVPPPAVVERRAQPDADDEARELEARVRERSAAAARARAALDVHRARWWSRFAPAPHALMLACEAAERELNAARDELIVLRRARFSLAETR